MKNDHDQMLKLLLPLIDYMNTNGFSYFLVAGKNNVASNYVAGNPEDINGMLESLFLNHPNIKEAVEQLINNLNQTANEQCND